MFLTLYYKSWERRKKKESVERMMKCQELYLFSTLGGSGN